MARTFLRFEEIEGDLKLNAPQTVYKYRTWKDNNHKSLLIDRLIWFSHPFDLNDPLDVRPETTFNLEEINDPRYLDKLIKTATHMHTERDRRIVAENRLEELRNKPNILLENRKCYNEKRKNFDRHGVFSTAMHELNVDLWKEYGDNHMGYCIGFDTVKLCRQMKSGYGYVKYQDEPYVFSFLDKNDDDLDILYLKKKKWEKENEFRFITLGIGGYSKRRQKFEQTAVKEIILGSDISENDQKEIIEIAKHHYSNTLPIYKITRNSSENLSKRICHQA